ncbi:MULTISPECIES: LysR family transcriptional regulator [unclassified Sphingobium]|uniref:LysR family transcriptional regulator n=1 Tax=unclassified Sphingobium TaxID=2611147 RepID=UPI0022241589|nr:MULTISPECIES: LysR family transcriptional regulator [unclassified Sphingobium]
MAGYGLHEFDAVLAIARKESFRAAAIDLGLSATALSNAIAKLEGQLGVRLFNRTTRSVSLTEAGHRFVEQVTPALRDIHHALDTVRSQQDTPSGTLRINTFATAAREIMQPLVLEFLKRFPQVRIDLVTEGALSDIVADGFDFGVRSRDLVPSDMIAIPVGPERRHAIVAAPAYLADRTHPRVPADLLAHPCIRIRLPNGVMYRWHFGAEGQSLHLEVDGPLILDEASVARLAVLEGVGIGFFMESDVRADIEAGRLVSLLPQWLPALTPICLYYPSRRNPPAAVKVFIDLARERSRAYRHE